jgi:hypothetical protein
VNEVEERNEMEWGSELEAVKDIDTIYEREGVN